jgi:2-polyprenyl-3-methyl-5-hydroxy-6-metoxy-1,4-benzoquinol methylase
MVCDPSSGGRRYDQAAVPSEPLRSRLESLTRRFRSDAPDDSASPFAVTSRNLATETRPEGGGTEGFETADAMRINAARLANLGSLGLPLEGRSVLDVGSGPGHLAQFFVDRGCRIVSTDARAENIERMHELYPAHDGHVADVEHDDLSRFGRFDVVFCYGLLYHLENPIQALRNMASACDDLLLIETMVCDSTAPVLRLEDEYLSANQALRGLAHRPSPTWLATALDRIGFRHVYLPQQPPEHPDYRFEWKNNLETARDGHLLRAIFVAGREPVEAAGLTPLVRDAP